MSGWVMRSSQRMFSEDIELPNTPESAGAFINGG